MAERQRKERDQPIVLPPYGVEPRGFHEKNAFADQANLIGRDAKVIFDVGAHIGETAEQYLRLFPDATVHCFEPFPDSFAQLVKKSARNDRVRCHCNAVSHRSGSSTLYTFVNSATNSLLPAAKDVDRLVEAGQMEPTGVTNANCVTIDEFCKQEQIDRIDILKLDVQGGELDALKGAEGMLARSSVVLIYTEVVFVPVYERQAWFFDVAMFLYRHGYALFDFYNFAYGGGWQLKWGDAVFLPKGHWALHDRSDHRGFPGPP